MVVDLAAARRAVDHKAAEQMVVAAARAGAAAAEPAVSAEAAHSRLAVAARPAVFVEVCEALSRRPVLLHQEDRGASPSPPD